MKRLSEIRDRGSGIEKQEGKEGDVKKSFCPETSIGKTQGQIISGDRRM